MQITRSMTLLAVLFSVQACAQSKAPVPAANQPVAKIAPSKPIIESKDDAVVRAALTKIAPGINIRLIKESPIAGFKEVVVDGKVLYVSSDGKYLLQGSLIDMAARKNITEASEAVQRKALLAAVPNNRKISFAPAAPKYRVTVFTDIDCGFCRKMHSQISEYNKLGIAVDYLFFPRAGIGSESFQKAVNVWCAPNRNVALTMAKNDRILPKKNCTNYVTMDYKLGLQAGVDGTPAVYTASGAVIGGYLSPEDMLKTLQSANN
jgi:thiol:disulfide interchange protein DsbC